MNNLGMYKHMVVFAKKVGGPVALGGIVAVAGWVVGRSGEAGGKGVVNAVRRRKQSRTQATEPVRVFLVAKTAECGNDLTLEPGDQFRILERVEDGVLIERIDDDNSPYVVPLTVLIEVSDITSEDVPNS